MTGTSGIVRDDPGGQGILIRLKAVPGASRDEIAGALGDRLKIRVAAPPEGGKANEAICRLLASELGVARRNVEVTSGHAGAEKTARVRAIDAGAARDRLKV